MSLKPPVSPNTPLGTGRVYFNAVADYGARGNGTTNDYAAITAAMTAASAVQGDVYLPPGTYATTAPILIPNGVRLLGSNPSNTMIKAKTGWSGTGVVMNAANDGTQEYAWIENMQVHGNDLASSCIVFDRVFVPSGLRNIVATNATGNGIVIKSNSAQLGGPVYLQDIWSLHHGNDCVLIDDVSSGVWARGITAEYPGNGFAGVRIKGASTETILLDGVHLENYTAATTCLGVVIDGAQNVHVRGIRALGYAAGAYSDIVKIQNTVAGTVRGITIEKIKTAQGTNYVNDTVNTRTFAMDGNQGFDSYQTEALILETPRSVGGSGQPAFALDWANYGGGFSTARFYKDAGGVVHIEGTITTPGGTGVGALIFSLPVGYRPAALQSVTAWRDDTGVTVGVQIAAGGGITKSTAVSAGGVISLNNISFYPA